VVVKLRVVLGCVEGKADHREKETWFNMPELSNWTGRPIKSLSMWLANQR
jgi:hypothetical protein